MPYKDKEMNKAAKRASYLRLKAARPEALITERYSILKYRYKEEGILSLDEYASLISERACHYCGGPLLKRGIGIDRLDCGQGHIAGNCVPCCTRCNSTFWDHYTYEEKLLLAETLRKIDRLRKAKGER
jgi:hypothetical protein